MKTARDSEVRFWALFTVVMALLVQVVFPPQLMAAETGKGMQFVLCTSGIDSAPIVDHAVVKATKSPHNGLNGLKCASCVLASITAITAPLPSFQPAIYSTRVAKMTPPVLDVAVHARAPPRPHSCGPPSNELA